MCECVQRRIKSVRGTGSKGKRAYANTDDEETEKKDYEREMPMNWLECERDGAENVVKHVV